jgi:hypothetical protein
VVLFQYRVLVGHVWVSGFRVFISWVLCQVLVVMGDVFKVGRDYFGFPWYGSVNSLKKVLLLPCDTFLVSCFYRSGLGFGF